VKQEEAREAYDALPQLHDYLRLDRIYEPPAGRGLDAKAEEILMRYQRARLRADIARSRLRAAADVPDVAERAALAIGSLSKRPEGPAAKARAAEGRKAQDNLQTARSFLEDLAIDEAEGFIDKLRKGGALLRPELAQALLIHGAIHAFRGRPDQARKTMGQGLCLAPESESPTQRPPASRIYAELAKARPCPRPLALGIPAALRRSSDEGPRIDIRVPYGPDPFDVVSGAAVEIWGSGGALAAVQQVRAIPERDLIEASFADDGRLTNLAGQVLLRVIAKDVSGVKLADLGGAEPLPVAVGEAESHFEFSLPWWVWVAGGVAVAGAAAAAIAATTRGEDRRGIGPINAEF